MPASRQREPRALVALALWLSLGVALAAPPDLARVLPQLQPRQRDALQTRAALWARWTAQERESFMARVRQWEQLPAAERALRRERYQAWQALPAEERGQVQAAAARFAALNAAEQQTLRAHFDALDGSIRRGFLLGPILGADYLALQPLLAQVPEEQHEPLLRALRTLTPQQRQDLAALVQRTPPQNREALRRELLSTAEHHLGDWLLIRLER